MKNKTNSRVRYNGANLKYWHKFRKNKSFDEIYGSIRSKQIRKKISISHKGKRLNFSQQHKNRISIALSNKPLSEEHKRSLSKGQIKRFQNLQERKKHSNRLKLLWSNKVYRNKQVKKILLAKNMKQNKQEKIIENILNKISPKSYKYVGNGKLIIDGFNPDFINCNGQKKIVEFFGPYHLFDRSRNKDKIKLLTYKKFGYKTLVIWYYELLNMLKVENKIRRFILK